MNKPINLDIILPESFDLTIKGKIVETYKDMEEYYVNEECFLQVHFEGNGYVCFDYYSDAGRFILMELFPDFDNLCTIENATSKQYEIANLIGLSTKDL